MKIMIHACPSRMWYVDGWLIPELKRQGAQNVVVWNDADRKGNLQSCMEAFAACDGPGGTWHLQDDILPARNFIERIDLYDGDHVVCGFVNENGGPDCNLTGVVCAVAMWYSFPCIYIPNAIARGCAEWFLSGRWESEVNPTAFALAGANRGDDYLFREYMDLYYGGDTAINLKPCLVEHIDLFLGGSVTSGRDFWARATYWDDEDLVTEIRQWIKAHKERI